MTTRRKAAGRSTKPAPIVAKTPSGTIRPKAVESPTGRVGLQAPKLRVTYSSSTPASQTSDPKRATRQDFSIEFTADDLMEAAERKVPLEIELPDLTMMMGGRPFVLQLKTSALEAALRPAQLELPSVKLPSIDIVLVSTVIRAFAEKVGGLVLGSRSEPVTAETVDHLAESLLSTFVEELTETGSPEEDLGPFYSTAGLAKRLRVSRQALDGRVQRHTLVALPADDGSRLYPTFQFDESGGTPRVLVGLSDVMKVLDDADLGPMETAAWLAAPTEELGGNSAVQHLREGGAVESVLALARADVHRWAS